MAKEPKTIALKEPAADAKAESAPQDNKKPTNLRANAVPVDGYVLSVDGKFKTRYDNAKDAMAAGALLKKTYPVIQVSIYNAVEHNYTPVELSEPEK